MDRPWQLARELNAGVERLLASGRRPAQERLMEIPQSPQPIPYPVQLAWPRLRRTMVLDET